MQPEALVEPFLVAVERVRVLHDELANAEQASARPGLVAVLRLEVVEPLRQVAVRAQLPSVEGHRLLMRHREDEVAARSVLELVDLGRDDAPGLLPELGRRQHRHEHLLGADRVHLLADDLRGVLVHAPAERQERPQACGDLPDVAAAHEELVARGVGIGRIVPKRRDEELRHAVHGRCAASAIMSAAGLASLARFGRSMPASIHSSISRKSSSTRISDSTFLSTRPCA